MNTSIAEKRPLEIDHSIQSWSKLVAIIFIQVTGFYGFWYGYENFSEIYPIIIISVAYYFFTMLGITLGAHRYGKHLGYVLKPFEAVIVVILAYSAALQGAIKWWIAVHTKHHRREDVIGEDPHTPREGFWHSYVLWLVRVSGCTDPEAEYYDIPKDPTGVNIKVIEWQSRNHKWLMPLMAFIVPIAFGALYGDWFAGLLIGGFSRIVCVWNFTWSVNSFGHLLGKCTTTRSKATNIGWGIFGWILGVLTCGESNHSNHHACHRCWNLSRGWKQADPGAWVLILWGKTGRIKFISKIPNQKKKLQPVQ